MKKQLIIEKALELFAKQGFEATSVQQITEHCGISKGAFYLSFKSKDELIIALIDHFMMQFISDIDHSVRNTDSQNLLYEFYFTTFVSFQQHSDFAKILMKEQSQSWNKDFIVKIRYYDKLMDKIILFMVERQFGETVQQIKYDLIYCIKGFMNTYSQLIIFSNVPFDMKKLSESLVEKTSILASHTTIPFITPEHIQMFEASKSEEITKTQIIESINQKIAEMDESIEKESLSLLKQHLLEDCFSRAIVKGLVENIRNHPHCKWIAYTLRSFYQF